ncbi:MAG: MotA/TolQ/ExbB proton channel family protein [Gemmatimonadota bacterium]|nr:MotA/TolQ/ExbB proton channel family protein [Gemmatimonadota bacterium]
MTTALGAAALQSVPSTFAIGDFWSLTQQAGPLRWPIFFVLAFGLVQVFAKAYELIRDRWASSALHSVDFTSMSLDEIAELVSRQGASMLASLHATLVNVFQTRPAEGLLHDEITNFVRFQQDQFDVFRKRMEFLSDTAGALGLMGTVWGMFTVFFQGTAEQDVILRGMGIALITTLLGLIVSIILNFGSTELSTLFNKRLERVSTKSDELRFRLMELAPRPADLGRTVPPGVEAAGRVSKARGEATAETGTLPGGTGPATGSPIRSSPPLPGWRYVEFDGDRHTVPAGEVASIGVVVKNGSDAPAAGVPVFVKIASGDAVLASGGRALRESSDAGGRVAVECRAPQRVGTFALEASLPEQPGSPSTVQVHVVAGEPQKIEKEGNNQAAVAGSRLPLPLGVRVHDRFGNPVRGLSVGFRVKQGDGKLGVGQTERSVPTDHQGLAATPFIVSSSAGQNIVAASIDGTKSTVEFVAFATEL